MMAGIMHVEIWSDVICPWCYIGKRRFEDALSKFDGADDVQIVWRAFELDPGAPPQRHGTLVQHLAVKYGMDAESAQASVDRLTRLAAAEGLEYHLDATRSGNTFNAHRLIHAAETEGIQGAMKERLLRAYFTEGAPIGDDDTLVRLAVEVGLDANMAATVLAGDAYASAVRADEQRAMEMGISGVPFFLIDGKFAIAGAQSADVILDLLERAATANVA